MARLVRTGLWLVSGALILAGCAAPGPGTGGQTAVDASAGAPKVLRLGLEDEPVSFFLAGGIEGREHGDIFHAGLTFYDSAGTLLPKLATKVPSIADDDWKTFADGSMEITWKLKPGLEWHDGAPVSSEDFAFTARMLKDPASSFSVPRALGLVGEVLTPDADTIVLRYPRVYNGAAAAGLDQFPPAPRHLLEEEYTRAGAEGLGNSHFWSTEWIGLGPFRMTKRTLGSHIEAEAFDHFVLGRPRIDRLVLRYFTDPTVLEVNLLSGDIDMVPAGGLTDPAGIADLKQQWESPGRGTVAVAYRGIIQIELQYRDPTAAWARDVRVRRAMMHLIDRQGIVDTVLQGLSEVADTALLPAAPEYAILQQRGLPRYPYDRAQAERLLDEAGWPRGGDGVRRNAEGAVFAFELLTQGGPEYTPMSSAIVAGLEAGGISTTLNLVAQSATNLNELRAKVAGGNRRPGTPDEGYWNKYLTSQIASAENRWRGANLGAYTNADFEALFGQWVTTVDPRTRNERAAGLFKVLADDVAYLPLFNEIQGFAYRKGLLGPKPFSTLSPNTTIDVHTWMLD